MLQTRRSARPTAATNTRARVVWTLVAAAIIGSVAGCREKSVQPSQTAKQPTVASLVPAATDLLMGMGAGDHLIAISNYDTGVEGTAGLSRVGDYLTTDWETLTRLHPHTMVIQLAKERVAEGFDERVRRSGIVLENLVLNRLEDIYPVIQTLGRATGETQKADQLAARLRRRLEAVLQRSSQRPKVRTVIMLVEDGSALVGPDNFLDDLLTIAGGSNVAANLGSPWPTADKEKLRSLAPEVVIILDPSARPDALNIARRFWQTMPNVPASRDGRIYLISDPYVLLNGSHVADMAEKMAEILHPPATKPTSGPLSLGTPGERVMVRGASFIQAAQVNQACDLSEKTPSPSPSPPEYRGRGDRSLR